MEQRAFNKVSAMIFTQIVTVVARIQASLFGTFFPSLFIEILLLTSKNEIPCLPVKSGNLQYKEQNFYIQLADDETF